MLRETRNASLGRKKISYHLQTNDFTNTSKYWRQQSSDSKIIPKNLAALDFERDGLIMTKSLKLPLKKADNATIKDPKAEDKDTQVSHFTSLRNIA